MTAGRLSDRLPLATRELHRQAERTGVMRRLLAGQVGPREYVRLLGSLHPIYVALEGALEDRRVRALAPMPQLRRTEALVRDLADYGATPATAPPARPAVDYATEISRLLDSDPLRITAHAYVRYLGDLSGGQLLRGIVARAGHVAPGRGLAFYELGDAEAIARAKADIRATLDALPAGRHDDLVAEAGAAFARHILLFDAIPAGGD